ncbi:MAG: glycosyltransferase [Candidatus Sungbacteria bacterium]|nr:glycosyltransferase [Candidatus Sungbacteria bacterium]
MALANSKGVDSQKIPASVQILTRNSAATLRRALQSARDFSEIVVCDGGSTDDTYIIAEQYDARIVRQDPSCLHQDGSIKDFSCVRNSAAAESSHDWILYIDSDESVPPELLAEIRDFFRAGRHEVYGGMRVPAAIIADGRRVRYSSNYPGYQVRFFNRIAGKFQKPVHERFFANSGMRIGTFESPWHYYVDTGRELHDFEGDLKRDLIIYRERFTTRGGRWRAIVSALRSIAIVSVKSVRNYLFHGFRESYPPRLEFLRIRYQWAIIKTLLWNSKSR